LARWFQKENFKKNFSIFFNLLLLSQVGEVCSTSFCITLNPGHPLKDDLRKVLSKLAQWFWKNNLKM
jgi:hypothetical protein